MSEERSSADSTVTVLNSFLQNDGQTLEQFSNLFQSITVDAGQTENENIDGMLSFLQNSENNLIRETNQDSDIGVFSIVSSSVPQGRSHNNDSSFSSSGVQCLDVMLNHLEARELSLERSPEYSIGLNFNEPDSSDLSSAITYAIDNRLQPGSENSENSSSEIPDNDRIVHNNQSDLSGRARNSSSDDIEVIPLEVTEGVGLNSSVSSRGTLVDFMTHSVNLRVDNFVSDEFVYDSDKDIDESELEPSSQHEISEDNSPYVPSFHANGTMISTVEDQLDEANGDIAWNEMSPPSISPFSCVSTDNLLPGECIDNDGAQSTDLVHIRAANIPSRDHQLGASNGEQQTITPDVVVPFQLDSNFNYDNVRITPRLSHYQ